MPSPAVHLQFNNPNARLDFTNGRAYPLPIPPGMAGNSEAIVAHLAVRRSVRYRAAAGLTFCNIYATDYCHLMGAYLPRVWWYPQALEKIQKEETVPVVYGKTVGELNANSLHNWLERWGLTFGWVQASFTETQHAVNSGAVGVLTAARKDAARPGHIAVIVPESPKHGKAAWDTEGVCLAPLQCQAGAINKEYWTGAGWWEASQLYRAVGCWYNTKETA